MKKIIMSMIENLNIKNHFKEDSMLDKYLAVSLM